MNKQRNETANQQNLNNQAQMDKIADKQQSLDKQAQKILRIAEKYGIESNYFFLTIFKRYQESCHFGIQFMIAVAAISGSSIPLFYVLFTAIILKKRRYEMAIFEIARKNFKTFTIATIFIL